MISLHKLARLPQNQGLRKSAKIIEETERRFLLKRHISNEELLYVMDILGFWIPRASPDLSKALSSVLETLKQCSFEANIILRCLNTVHHLLRRETGQYPADWDFDAADSSGGLDLQKRQIFSGMEVYLEDIRSPFNVGAMFRSAESFGAEKLYLSPFCADPNHRRAQRTAMGCVSAIPWIRLSEDPFAGEESTASASFPPKAAFFALETGGTKLEHFPFPKQGIMIAGSEELGVSPNALAAADASLGRVSIPIYGAKGSLNVSVAFGIAMHAWAASLENLQIRKDMV
jgi:TrmH family RNA methyltransferase